MLAVSLRRVFMCVAGQPTRCTCADEDRNNDVRAQVLTVPSAGSVECGPQQMLQARKFSSSLTAGLVLTEVHAIVLTWCKVVRLSKHVARSSNNFTRF